MPLKKAHLGNREDGRHDKEREGMRDGRKDGNTSSVEEYDFQCGQK